MKKKDAFEISIRVLGILLFLYSITSIKELSLYVVTSSMDNNIYNQNYIIAILLITLLIQWILAITLLLKSRNIARFLIKDNEENNNNLSLYNQTNIYKISLTLIAIIIIILSLPNFIVSIIKYIYLVQKDVQPKKFEIIPIPILGLKLILSAALLFYSTKISVYLSKRNEP